MHHKLSFSFLGVIEANFSPSSINIPLMFRGIPACISHSILIGGIFCITCMFLPSNLTLNLLSYSIQALPQLLNENFLASLSLTMHPSSIYSPYHPINAYVVNQTQKQCTPTFKVGGSGRLNQNYGLFKVSRGGEYHTKSLTCTIILLCTADEKKFNQSSSCSSPTVDITFSIVTLIPCEFHIYPLMC